MRCCGVRDATRAVNSAATNPEERPPVPEPKEETTEGHKQLMQKLAEGQPVAGAEPSFEPPTDEAVAKQMDEKNQRDKEATQPSSQASHKLDAMNKDASKSLDWKDAIKEVEEQEKPTTDKQESKLEQMVKKFSKQHS